MLTDRLTTFGLAYKKICYKGKHRHKGSKRRKRPLAALFKYHDNGGNQSASDKINNKVRNIHSLQTSYLGTAYFQIEKWLFENRPQSPAKSL